MPGKMFHGCVGAIDGWLTIINKPNVNNDADYRSGHYNCFGPKIEDGEEINYRRTTTINEDDGDHPLPTTHLRDTILAQVIAMDL
jgi:hypothetical protein